MASLFALAKVHSTYESKSFEALARTKRDSIEIPKVVDEAFEV